MVGEHQTAGKKEFLYEFLSHLGVTTAYLLFVSLFLSGFSIFFWIGGLLGMYFLDLDHLRLTGMILASVRVY